MRMAKISGSPDTRPAQTEGRTPDMAGSVLAADDEDGHREQPACPRHHCGMGPTEPSHERTTELVDRSRSRAANHAQTEDPGQDVRSRSRYHQRHNDLSRVGEVQRKEIADEGRQAEDGGLPIERQGQAEAAQGIPQWNVSVVDLRPCLGRPRDHLGDLIPADGVADGHARYLGQARPGQDVIRTKREPMMKGGRESQYPCSDDPCDTDRMRKERSPASRHLLVRVHDPDHHPRFALAPRSDWGRTISVISQHQIADRRTGIVPMRGQMLTWKALIFADSGPRRSRRVTGHAAEGSEGWQRGPRSDILDSDGVTLGGLDVAVALGWLRPVPNSWRLRSRKPSLAIVALSDAPSAEGAAREGTTK